MEKTLPDLEKALKASAKAKTQWKDLTPLARRDFTTWVESAKQEETRKRRVRVAIDKLVAGKRRPCCYAVVPMNLYKALGTNAKAKAKWKDLSADARRDFSDWIEKAKDSDSKAMRVDKAILMIGAGKKHP